MTPDWLVQLTWFAAGICATGAFWYFLSQRKYHATLWIGSAAVVLALLAVAFHIRNDLVTRERQGTLLDRPKPIADQTLDQALRQLTDMYGPSDQQMAPLGKRVVLLSSHPNPIYVHVDLVEDEYRLSLKASNQEEVVSWNSADLPKIIQFSIRAEPIDVPYELTVAIDKEQVTYTVTLNIEFAKTRLRSAFVQDFPKNRR